MEFLTDFTRLKYTSGYPLEVTSFVDQLSSGYYYVQTFYNLSGTQTGTYNVAASDTSAFAAAFSVELVRIDATPQIAIPAGSAYYTLAISTTTVVAGAVNTPLRVDIETSVCDSPLSIAWLNRLGGWEHYVFQSVKRRDFEVFEQNKFRVYDAREVSTISKRAREKVTIRAKCLPSEINGFRWLLSSELVVLLNGYDIYPYYATEASPNINIDILTTNLVWEEDEDYGYYNADIEFLLPEMNN